MNKYLIFKFDVPFLVSRSEVESLGGFRRRRVKALMTSASETDFVVSKSLKKNDLGFSPETCEVSMNKSKI